MVEVDPSKPIDGMSENEFMIAFHAGELAALNGLSVLDSAYLDDKDQFAIWMLGYLEEPIPDQPTRLPI